MAITNIVKYLKTLTIIIGFLKMFLKFSYLNNLKIVFRAQKYCLGKLFPSKTYLYMGETFKIGLGSLGGIWGMVALNVHILSKNKVMNIGGRVCFR